MENEGREIPQRVLLRTKQASAYLNLPASTLEKLRSLGGSPKYAKLGRIVIYDRDDLDAWVDARKRTCTLGDDSQRTSQ